MENNLNLNCDRQTGENLDATVKSFTLLVHEAESLCTASPLRTDVLGNKVKASAIVGDMMQSRRLRRIRQRTRIPNKTTSNLAFVL